jgi:hypothetical protein
LKEGFSSILNIRLFRLKVGRFFSTEKYNFAVVAITILIIGSLFLLEKSNTSKILRNAKYSVAEITSIWHSKKGLKSFGVDYSYNVNGESYTRQISVNLIKGKKYLAIYDTLNPINCKILEIYPIHRDIKIPVQGWRYEEVPITIDSLAIKKYIDSF